MLSYQSGGNDITNLNANRPYRNLPASELEAVIDLACDADHDRTLTAKVSVTAPARNLARELPVSALVDMDAELALQAVTRKEQA